MKKDCDYDGLPWECEIQDGVYVDPERSNLHGNDVNCGLTQDQLTISTIPISRSINTMKVVNSFTPVVIRIRDGVRIQLN